MGINIRVKRSGLAVVVFWVLGGMAAAQDVHFSQFEQVPLFTNVGQTGLHAGAYRIGAVYRNQWFSVPVPYSTYGLSAEARLLPDKIERDILAAGLQIVRDVAGDSRLSATQIQLSLGYSKRLADSWFLFGAANVGVAQRRFSTADLQFDDQYDGDRFNAGVSSNDLGNFRQTNFIYADFGAALGLRWQQSRRTFLNMGAAARHLNQPSQRFMSGEVRLGVHISSHLQGSAELHPKHDLLFSAQYQQQGPYKALMTGLGWRYHLKQSAGRETAVFTRLSARWGDAIIPMIGIEYQNWVGGLSYDVNTSGFNAATNRNGAVELTLLYYVVPVPKFGTIKSCPVL